MPPPASVRWRYQVGVAAVKEPAIKRSTAKSIRPNRPELMAAFNRREVARKRCVNPAIATTPCRVQAARRARDSSRVTQWGFSIRSATRFSAAFIAASKCRLCGRQMLSPSSPISKSCATEPKAAAPKVCARFLARSAWESAIPTMSAPWAAKACAWAIPIWPAPAMPIRIFRFMRGYGLRASRRWEISPRFPMSSFTARNASSGNTLNTMKMTGYAWWLDAQAMPY